MARHTDSNEHTCGFQLYTPIQITIPQKNRQYLENTVCEMQNLGACPLTQPCRALRFRTEEGEFIYSCTCARVSMAGVVIGTKALAPGQRTSTRSIVVAVPSPNVSGNSDWLR